jgi:hypothetical protein
MRHTMPCRVGWSPWVRGWVPSPHVCDRATASLTRRPRVGVYFSSGVLCHPTIVFSTSHTSVVAPSRLGWGRTRVWVGKKWIGKQRQSKSAISGPNRAEESKCQINWMSVRETVVELPWLRTVVRA